MFVYLFPLSSLRCRFPYLRVYARLGYVLYSITIMIITWIVKHAIISRSTNVVLLMLSVVSRITNATISNTTNAITLLIITSISRITNATISISKLN